MKLIEDLYEIEGVCRSFEAKARRTYRLEKDVEKIFDDLTQLVAD